MNAAQGPFQKLKISTARGTYISSDKHSSRVFASPYADLWERWTAFYNSSQSALCLQSHTGKYLDIGRDDVTLADECDVDHMVLPVFLPSNAGPDIDSRVNKRNTTK